VGGNLLGDIRRSDGGRKKVEEVAVGAHEVKNRRVVNEVVLFVDLVLIRLTQCAAKWGGREEALFLIAWGPLRVPKNERG